MIFWRIYFYHALLLVFLVINLHGIHAQAPPTTEAVLRGYGIANTPPALRVALRDPNPNIRSFVASVLATTKDTDSIPFLQNAMAKEKVETVKVAMASALATLDNWKGLDSLRASCADSSLMPTTRLMAANRLLDADDKSCTFAVIDILEKNPDPPSLELGLEFLRRITLLPMGLSARTEAVLLMALRDHSPLNRQYAGECLSIFGDSAAVSGLQKAVSEERDDRTRTHLQESLDRLRAALRQKSAY